MHRHEQTRHQNTQRVKSPPAPSPQKSRTRLRFERAIEKLAQLGR
jgi:hypothetical protein